MPSLCQDRQSLESTSVYRGTGACGYTDPESINSLGELANYYSNTYSYNPAGYTPEQEIGRLQRKWATFQPKLQVMNYYAVMIFYEGLESWQEHPENPLDPEILRQAVQDLDLTSGVAVDVYPGDRIQFDEKRDNPYVRATVLQVLNGEPKVVWPFEDAEAEAVFPRPDANY
jgi:branched-chain amino acid transport system substrate-binding protein